MKYILLILVFALVSCQDTNSNSLDELAFGQPELDLGGGGGSGGGSGGGGATPYQLAINVVNTKCTSCHTSYHSSWTAYTTEQDWIDAVSNGSDLVVPGDPDNSKLIDRLKIYGITGPKNMPQDPDPALTATEYGYLDDWIRNL